MTFTLRKQHLVSAILSLPPSYVLLHIVGNFRVFRTHPTNTKIKTVNGDARVQSEQQDKFNIIV